MNQKKIKQGLLVVLVLALVWVWWDAFRSMSPDAPGFRVIESGREPASGTAPEVTLPYQEPAVNPFQQDKPEPAPEAPRQRDGRQRPEVVPLLSESHRLMGILHRGGASQAVVAGPDGKSNVYSLGDSIGTWQVLEISDHAVILGQAKLRDSIILYDASK